MKLLVVLVLLIMTMDVVVAESLRPIDQNCVGKWESLIAKYKRDYPRILSDWEALRTQCQGTGYYEFRLATLHERTGNLEEAKSIVNKQLKSQTDYDHMLKLAKYI